MKKFSSTFLLFCTLFLTTSYCLTNNSKTNIYQASKLISLSVIPDSIIIDTITFEDINDEYTIFQYKINDRIIQMDIDRKDSNTKIDYILWDMDKNGRMEAIGVYNILEQKFDYHLIEEDLAAEDLLEFQVQLEDIGFPSFFNSSEIPKAVYKSNEHQPTINHL